MGKVLKIREVGDPILNKISDEVDIENINEESLEIIEDLKSTLEFGTGLGIAASQIGINKRIIVVGAKKENIKYNDAEEIPVTAMLNPTWKEISKETMPIIMDESFAYYDKERMTEILEYLSELENRQILIFTCSDREEKILEKEAIKYSKIEL